MSPAPILQTAAATISGQVAACSTLMADLEAPRLPLYLSRDEAETLVALCASSPTSGGGVEAPLFAGLGELLRAFWREKAA